MIRYFVHRGGRTELVDRLDPAWFLPAHTAPGGADAGVTVWADVAEPTEADGAVLRDVFGRCREAGMLLREAGMDATELSMGMSGDYEVAVEEGATMIRLGTILFGARKP